MSGVQQTAGHDQSRAARPLRRMRIVTPGWLLGALLRTLLCVGLLPVAQANISVRDDTGQLVRLAHPARRIIALSPQLVELSYAAGAGSKLIATVQHADAPPAARRLRRVGDAFALNLEAIASLKPDLILAWKSGTPPRQIDTLQRLGIPVYWSQTDSLQAIASTVQRIGELAGTEAVARPWVRDFNARMAALRARYAGLTPVRVFYQVWGDPLMTVGGPQLINQAIDLCGGVNPFATLPLLAPSISREAVIAADPQLIVAASSHADALDVWTRDSEVSAVRHGQLVLLNPHQLPRMGAQVLDGVAQLCAAIARTRGIDGRR